jgi:uncharacterized membrane protein YcaP (DUF421 family)
MSALVNIDWTSLFKPTVPIAETVLRGTIVYLSIFAIFRVLRRGAGAISISDLLVVVLIADAAQNAMASDYTSITDGLILVATIAVWDYALDWLGYRSPSIRRLTSPSPLLLIKDGRLRPQNLRKQLITKEELLEQLRQQGVERIEDVKVSYMESDGRISVVKQDQSDSAGGSRTKRPVT